MAVAHNFKTVRAMRGLAKYHSQGLMFQGLLMSPVWLAAVWKSALQLFEVKDFKQTQKKVGNAPHQQNNEIKGKVLIEQKN